MLLSADCLPVALARTNGDPAVAVLHIGWRGLLAGIAESGAAALGGEPFVAAIGPGIGPCCYEVGDQVADPSASASGTRSSGDGTSTCTRRPSARYARRAPSASSGSASGSSCEEDLFFSHRRDQGRTGRQGILAVIR